MAENFESPWRIRLYSPASLMAGDAGNAIGDVWAPKSLDVSLRWNRVSTAVVKVALGDPSVPALLEDGVRIKIWRNGELVFTGCVDLLEINGPTSIGQVSATFQSDWAIMHQLVSHPYGSGAPGNDPEFYFKSSGAAEAVAKDLIRQSAAKWGASYVSVRPNHSPALGGSVSISTRYEDLNAILMPIVDQQNVGITVIHDGSKLVVECVAVTDFPRTLDEASGIVADWSLSSAAPNATKITSGSSYTETGSTTRKWYETTSTDAALASKWGVRVGFKAPDGGKSGEDLAAVQANVQQATTAGLKDNGPKTGISVKLSETGTFEYGAASGLLVGKRVAIDLEGVKRTDILREVQFSYSAENGDKTTPVVGDIAGDPDNNLGAFLASVKKGLKRLEVKNS